MANTEREKMEYIVSYIRALHEIEKQIQPLRDELKEIRKEYKANKWLTSEDMKSANKAYRLIKTNSDIDAIYDSYSAIIGYAKDDEEGGEDAS